MAIRQIKDLVNKVLMSSLLIGGLVGFSPNNLNHNSDRLFNKSSFVNEVDIGKKKKEIVSNEIIKQDSIEKNYFIGNKDSVYEGIKLEKKGPEKLFVYDFLDILSNDPYLEYDFPELKKEYFDSTIKKFEEYYPTIPKKECSEFSLEEVKDVFLKIDKSIPKVKKDISNSCLFYTLAYQAIGEVYDFPIFPVFTPPSGDASHHIFARWDCDGKNDALNPNNPINKGDFNWDNNSSIDNYYGIYRCSNEDIIDNYFISKKALENRVYLKNLNKKEMSALAYFLVSDSYVDLVSALTPTSEQEAKEAELEAKGYFSNALKFSNKALELDSLCIPAYDIKAQILGGFRTSYKDFKGALRIIDKAIKLSPNQENLIITKADIYNYKNSDFAFKNGLFPLNDSTIEKYDNSDMKKYFELMNDAIKIAKDKVNKGLKYDFPNYPILADFQKEVYTAYTFLSLQYFCLNRDRTEIEKEVKIQELALDYIKSKEKDQIEEIKNFKYSK